MTVATFLLVFYMNRFFVNFKFCLLFIVFRVL